MLLSILDRLMVLNLLPKKGDVTTLRVIGEVQESVGFTNDEYDKLNFTHTDKGTNWENTVEPKEIQLGSAAAGLLRKALKTKDDAKELTLDELPFYDRIMGEDNGKEASKKSGKKSD